MNCDRAKKSLPEYLDGALASAARFAVEAHLNACAACRTECETQRRLSRLLTTMPRRQLGPEFDAALSARLRELDATPPTLASRIEAIRDRLRVRFPLDWRVIAAPAALAALCLGLWRPWTPSTQDPPAAHAYTGRIVAAYHVTGGSTDIPENEAVDEALRAASVESLIE
jgi:anti-sigma factor RsiW